MHEDEDGNTVSVQLWDKVFTADEILLLKGDNGAGDTTYTIFKSIDEQTRECNHTWVTDWTGLNEDEAAYTGQLDSDLGKSGVGSVAGEKWATYEEGMEHGFLIDESIMRDEQLVHLEGEKRDDAYDGIVTEWWDGTQFFARMTTDKGVVEVLD